MTCMASQLNDTDDEFIEIVAMGIVHGDTDRAEKKLSELASAPFKTHIAVPNSNMFL